MGCSDDDFDLDEEDEAPVQKAAVRGAISFASPSDMAVLGPGPPSFARGTSSSAARSIDPPRSPAPKDSISTQAQLISVGPSPPAAAKMREEQSLSSGNWPFMNVGLCQPMCKGEFFGQSENIAVCDGDSRTEAADIWKRRQEITGVVAKLVHFPSDVLPGDDFKVRLTPCTRLEVFWLRPSGMAERHGVKKGDVLASIDGHRFDEQACVDFEVETLKAPCSLVFLGFVGNINAEVRMTSRKALPVGLSARYELLSNKPARSPPPNAPMKPADRLAARIRREREAMQRSSASASSNTLVAEHVRLRPGAGLFFMAEDASKGMNGDDAAANSSENVAVAAQFATISQFGGEISFDDIVRDPTLLDSQIAGAEEAAGSRGGISGMLASEALATPRKSASQEHAKGQHQSGGGADADAAAGKSLSNALEGTTADKRRGSEDNGKAIFELSSPEAKELLGMALFHREELLLQHSSI